MMSRSNTVFSLFLPRLLGKPYRLVIGISIVILFGDTLIPLFGHALHFIVELIESFLEHFLESAFGFTEKQAQFFIFYSWLFISLYVSWRLLKKAYLETCSFCAKARDRWREFSQGGQKSKLITVAVLSALGASVMIFS